jgi:acyl dehydratase
VRQGTRDALYENVEVGERFGPVELVVDDHKVKTFAFTQDDSNPWCLSGSPFGARIGHAALLANDLLTVYYEAYDRNTVVGLHSEEELWFVSPVRVGERVMLTGRYVDKYVKRGQGYVVLEAEARGEDDRLLVRHRGTEIMRTQPGAVAGGRTAEVVGRRVTAETRDDLAVVTVALPGLEQRRPIAALVKRVTQEQISVYSYCGEYTRNIHTDLEVAQRAGLRLPIMQGQMQACYLSELATSFFGAPWFTTGRLKLKFLAPVEAGETLTIAGAVLGELDDADGRRLEIEVWTRRPDGTMCAAGWASALIEPERVA